MNDDLIPLDLRHVWHPFTQAQTASKPLLVDSASGAILKTRDGREIVDLISSWWVNLYGHAHPKIVNAISEQAARLEQVIFAGFTHEPAIKLSHELSQLLPGDLNRVFFSDDGSTAVEVALKIAYQYWRNTGKTGKTRFMTFEGGYHGDTLGAMSAGASSGYFSQWNDLMFSVDAISYPETWMDDDDVDQKEDQVMESVAKHLEQHADSTSAMILEPLVQGAAGMRMARPTLIARLVDLLQSHEVLVIFDEIMTGFGRTGSKFACEQIGITPDLICLSKGLTAGFLPLSVTVATDQLYESFLDSSFDRAFAHGHSFTANPLGCAAALASIELLRSQETELALKRIHQAHLRGIQKLSSNPHAKKLRVSGTIGAFDADLPNVEYGAAIGEQFKSWFLNRGLLIRPIGTTFYLLPPYCTSDEQIDCGWDAMNECLETFANSPTTV